MTARGRGAQGGPRASVTWRADAWTIHAMIERMVLLGASGDLVSRLVLPAIAELHEAGLLPARFTIVGAARSKWSTAQFRAHITEGLERFARVSAASRDAVTKMLSYESADVTRGDVVASLVGAHADRPDTLVYLALPTSLFAPVVDALAASRLRSSDAVALEKPFGTDRATAKQLNEMLRRELPAPTIFRVDHFLSSDLVRRVVALRLLNRVFESTWNAAHIERVEVSWMERLTLEGRAGYYDHAGALADMLQNHLMEVLALIAMEAPARGDDDSVRSARVAALRSVVTPSRDDVRRNTVRGRYTAGVIGTRKVPSYVDEKGVDPTREIETYASITLAIDNERWAGVPFTLRSGKAVANDVAEIAIHYRAMPGANPNVLRIGLEAPYVKLSTTLHGDHELALETAAPVRSAYANVFLEMLRRDETWFVRSDEAEEAWRIVDPIVKGWRAGDVPMTDYRAGTEIEDRARR